ncbi:hypothetical protein HDU86_004437 [Geranomyces michiganensis]|nr:hypothetical protein HDU86_004437 [Geranomyces michiganensis]
MHKRGSFVALLILYFLALVSAKPALDVPAVFRRFPQSATGSGVGVHDPSIVRAPNGMYILYGTAPGIGISTSYDRRNWVAAGTAFRGTPWADHLTGPNGNLWAPDVTYVNGQFVMYYSASQFGTQNSEIYMATSPTGLANSWTHKGRVFSSAPGVSYNAIDPNLLIANGKWYLSFGSFFSGIHQIELCPSTGMPLVPNNIKHLASRNVAPGAVEAASVYRAGQYYYMLVSWDKCCAGAASTYRIMAGRSLSPRGPFFDKNGVDMAVGGGTELMRSHNFVHGPGGQSVLHDGNGFLIAYHWYHDDNTHSLGINNLAHIDGWPVIQ